jgi:hypothetical protein
LKILKGETYKNRLLIDYIRDPASIRHSCYNLWTYAEQDQLKHFHYAAQKLPAAADYVLDVILDNYPKLDIPYHGRWRHFESAGINRIQILEQNVEGTEFIRSAIELTIISILLDAGAGAQWHYMDHLSETTLAKSEGLAVASYNLFMRGIFSSDPDKLYQADALGLQNLSLDTLSNGLQVAAKNPIIGLAGRLELLQKLGRCVQDKDQYFGDSSGPNRLGNIISYWQKQAQNYCLPITAIFNTILDAFSDIWPGRYTIDGVNLGDVWPHSLNCTDLNPRGFVMFHKLSQWLCYSLIEPLETIGIKVTGLDSLTGLPEYRNGGLFVDLSVLTPKDANAFEITHSLGSEFIVEWRAMTVVLLDKLAAIIRDKLSLTAEQLPLVKVLQGGTWLAGRKIAQKLRSDGGPPFKLDSDGTLF